MMTQRLTRLGVALVLLAWPAMVAAQAAGAPATRPPAAPGAAAPPPAQEPYTYDPAGRRDPFVSLVARGTEPTTGKRAVGLAGLTTAEVTLTGVYQSKVAFLKGPDGKTFSARVNDRLADGTIRSITAQSIVIMQEVNDPLSLVKVKEVRKGLRASDDVKQ
jgi:hypothetical protein